MNRRSLRRSGAMCRLCALLAAATLLLSVAPAATATAAPPPARTVTHAAPAAAVGGGGGRGGARLLGRLARVLVRAGVPPAVLYSLLGGGVLGAVGYQVYRSRRDVQTRPGDRHAEALARKLRDERDDDT
jgi:hypothetical protein